MTESSFKNIKHIEEGCHRNPWMDEPDWEEKRESWRDGPRPQAFPEHLRWAGHHLIRLEGWVNEGQECYNCPQREECDPEYYDDLGLPCPMRREKQEGT